MKYLNKFENFDNDESRSSGDGEFPQYNQANRLKAKQYVDDMFSKGAGDEVTDLCKEVGCDMPQDDDGLDEIKEKAIAYFIENPERMKNFGGTGFKNFPAGGGDGVVRTNNIGGVHEDNKFKPGPGEANSIRLGLNKDEMKLFSSKAQLTNLIRRNKVTLHNGEVWFNKEDEPTIRILNIFFDLAEDEDVNEVNEHMSETPSAKIDVIAVQRKRDDVIFRIGETYKDLNDHEYTISAITEGGGGIFYLEAAEGGFINVLNAIKI